MALRGGKSVGIPATSSAAVTLLLLFLALFISVAGATTSSFGMCFSELQACQGDAECSNCIIDWGPGNSDSSECVDYAVVASSTSTLCSSGGARNCCYFEDGTANTCMQNALMIEYWSCIMELDGCTLDDMPCYGTTTSSTSAELDISVTDDDETDGSTRKSLGAFAIVLVTIVAALGLAV